MRRWGQSVINGLVTAVFGAAFALMPLSVKFEESTALWWLFHLRGAIQPPPEAVLVAIDGTTGASLNLPKLPRDWPRTVHAELIRNLVARGAEVIVFDMDFSRVKEEEDAIFAEAVRQADRVVLYEPLVAKKQFVETSDGTMVTWIEQKVSPSPRLATTAKALGPFPLPKLGRTAFEFWTFKPSTGNAPTTPAIALQLYAMPYYDRWLDTLSRNDVLGLRQLPAKANDVQRAGHTQDLMLTLRTALNNDANLHQKITSTIDRGTDLADKERNVLKALTALYTGPENGYLNLYGPAGTIERMPYQVVIRPEFEPGTPRTIDLRGKVVFVGYSDLADPEQPDRFYTVFTDEDGVDLSGVEIMATAFANLLTDSSLRPSSMVATIAIVLAFGFTVGAALYLFPAMIGVAFGVGASVIYAAVAQWAFNAGNLWLPLATPILVQLPLALLIGLMGQYLVERRMERRMSRAISYYLPEHVVRDLTEKHLDPSKTDKVVYGTCLATDMSGFTSIAENKSPTELATFMNAYFDAIADALKRHSVDITNFHADTIMSAWIGIQPNPAARKNAILAALDVTQAIAAFSKREDSFKLNARIGLQDGNFYIGHTGGGGRLAYSILGDPANTASRLESLNKELGTHILAAQSVIADLSSGILTRPLGSFRLVGKAEAIPVLEIVAQRFEATDEQANLCEMFEQALNVLRAGQLQEAIAQFESILALYKDDGPTRYYLARCMQSLSEDVREADLTIIHLDRK